MMIITIYQFHTCLKNAAVVNVVLVNLVEPKSSAGSEGVCWRVYRAMFVVYHPTGLFPFRFRKLTREE